MQLASSHLQTLFQLNGATAVDFASQSVFMLKKVQTNFEAQETVTYLAVIPQLICLSALNLSSRFLMFLLMNFYHAAAKMVLASMRLVCVWEAFSSNTS
jgi:hypothetical protein